MRRFAVRYATAADLRAHLEEHEVRGVILLPMQRPPDVEAMSAAALVVQSQQTTAEVKVEVVQVLPAAGLVVRVTDLGGLDLSSLPTGGSGTVLEVIESAYGGNGGPEWDGNGASQPRPQPKGPAMPAGSSALSWPVEKLQAEWEDLPMPERIRVARYGNRGARMVVMRGRDKSMQIHLLANSNISTEEVASLAGSAALDPAALRRIVGNREWLRSAEVTRNLICNPKLPLPEVERLLAGLSQEELARINRSGRIRASVKQAVQKRLGRSQKG